MSIIRLIGINFAVFAALFLLLELGLHIIWPEQNPLLSPPFVPSPYRVAHPFYGHALLPNSEWEDQWGIIRSKIITNSLGFKDALKRDVPLHLHRKRVLFLGDSFTEGIGLSYEQTFVGRFASAYPQLDVLNAGVSYYSPSGYYTKAKYLLGTGLIVDEVIVYIDISDIQDEATRFREEGDRLQEGDFNGGCASPAQMLRSQLPWWARFSYTMDFFYKQQIASSLARHVPTMNLDVLVQPGGIYARDLAMGSWTYDANARCYGRLGVEGAIGKAIAEMEKLQALLSARNIPLSVGVYPWPQQLLYDDENSRQVLIWREWCKDKCRRFLNHFPTFFAYKRDHPNFLRDLFIWGDVHYNALGHELIARDLIVQY